MCLHVRSLAPDLIPYAAKDSWLTNQIMGTRTAIKALSSVDLRNLRIWPSYDLTRALMRLPDFWSRLHVPEDTTHVYKRPNADVTQRQPMTSLGYISKHVSSPHIPSLYHCRIIIQSFDMSSTWFVDRWLIVVHVDYCWLWLLALTFDQKSKFTKMIILLNFSHKFWFWTLFLHLKPWNQSIGTFFIMVSTKAFFKGSSHAYPTSSLHQASALSLKEGIRDILDILV